VAPDIGRLRAQLSSLQSLLSLSELMGHSGDQQRILQLAGTAIPSLSRCQLVGVHLNATGWGLVGPAGGAAEAMAQLSSTLDRLGPYGGAVPWSATASATAPGWVWAYPVQSSTSHAGLLVVAAAAEPPVEERFVLQALAQQTGVALVNAQLQADEHAAAMRALEAKTVADRANLSKSQFLSGMSHELRTPLNAILGFGQLLQLDDLTSQQRQSVDQILRAGHHLLSLIREVLDLSRIEAGNLPLTLEPVNVSEILKETVDLIRPLAAERGLGIDAPSQRSCGWTVQADRQRLRQILLNLASNAVKYNRDHGSIKVSCQAASQGRMCITVSDTGPGIPADKMARLFTPFDRLGADQTGIQGTGMGLVLSRRLAEAIGGTLTAHSVHGEGSTFTLELGLAGDLVERDEERLPAQPAPIQGPGSGPERAVLSVESKPASLRLANGSLAGGPACPAAG
jgi:signal transduction histidine kinase